MAIDLPLHLFSDTRAIRVGYFTDQTKYVDFVATSAGGLTITPRSGQAVTIGNSGNLSVGGSLSVTGSGPHNIGSASSFATTALIIDLTFTATGSFGTMFRIRGGLTGGTGNVFLSSFLAGASAGGSITTQGLSQAISVVATMHVTEPQITVGTGDTITTAATVYIGSAPTEGSNNYALFVDSGATRLDGVTYINDTANANMTVGLTINGGANDNQHLCLKNSDVAHGLTTAQANGDFETDDFLVIEKANATIGGVRFRSIAEDAAESTPLSVESFGGTADTAKTTAARGLIELYAAEHDGANTLANITADGNVFAVRALVGGSNVARMMVDEDGDLYSVTTAQTFDTEDDLALVRALDLVRGGDTVRNEWDEFVQYNEADLIRFGILGGAVADGGMTNVTQLQRLHNGALVQLNTALQRTQRAFRHLIDNPHDRAGALKLLEA